MYQAPAPLHQLSVLQAAIHQQLVRLYVLCQHLEATYQPLAPLLPPPVQWEALQQPLDSLSVQNALLVVMCRPLEPL